MFALRFAETVKWLELSSAMTETPMDLLAVILTVPITLLDIHAQVEMTVHLQHAKKFVVTEY